MCCRWARIRLRASTRTRALIENLARETLELHTLGVRSGYSDAEAAWIDGIPRRIDIATEFAGRASRAEPLELLESGLGPLASTQTRETVARAESRGQALALFVMASEFLRR